MASIADFFVTLGLDVQSSQFAEGIVAAEGLTGALKAVVAAALDIGKAVFNGLKEIISQTSDAGFQVQQLAARTGVSTRTIQELGYAAGTTGVEMGTLATALNQLAKKGVKDVQGEIYKLADKMAALPANGSRAQLAMSLLGRAGGKLVPLLSKGSDEIRRLGAEAESMGAIMSDQAVASSVAFRGSMYSLNTAVDGLIYTIGTPLLEALKPVIDQITIWISQHRKLIAVRVLQVLEGMADALKLMWPVLEKAGSWLLIMFERLLYWAKGTGKFLSGLWTLATTLLAPFIAVAKALAFVGLLLEDFFTFLDGGDSVIGDLVHAFEEKLPLLFEKLKPVAVEAWGWVKAAGQVAFGELFDWVLAKFAGIVTKIVPGGNSLKGALPGIVGTAGLAVNSLMGPAGGELFSKGINALAGAPTGSANGTDFTSGLMGGGASPTASQAAAVGNSRTSSVTNNVNAPISIQMREGQSPSDVAGAVSQHLDRLNQSDMGAAEAAARGG